MQVKDAITSSLHTLGAKMRTTAQRVRHRMVTMATPVA